ncbi:MAG: FprA family A-type flavoprotein [Vallitaleaceae bacterium]|nr:FprA family A-type flavoprotein [Vallitaleaceae bacterium]
MQEYKIVKDDIYWIGALDYDIRVFDIVMETKYGTTYNAYLVKGSSKTVLFETVKEKFFDEYLKRLTALTSVEDIDYIIVNHTEPDHAGSIAKLLQMNPEITLIGTSIALKYLAGITNMTFKSKVAKEGEVLDLGGKTVQFISVPNLHWPDSMYSYIPEDKALFTCDSFGCHYCSDAVFNDCIDEDFTDAYKYYFDAIMSPFKPFVLKALQKIAPLDIETICPGHGPVLRMDIPKYLKMYQDWSLPHKVDTNYIVIPYVSAYGYTKLLAEKIKEGIESEGLVAKMYDLVEEDKEEVLAQMQDAIGLLFGSPTILSDALPPIWELLYSLNPIIHKGKYAGSFGSYGWSGEAVTFIDERLKQLRFKVPMTGLKIVFNPSEDQQEEALAFGKYFAAFIKTNHPIL